jgi:hypothetical protein
MSKRFDSFRINAGISLKMKHCKMINACQKQHPVVWPSCCEKFIKIFENGAQFSKN